MTWSEEVIKAKYCLTNYPTDGDGVRRDERLIYSDGSYENGVMGIGVYSQDCTLSIARTLRQAGTNNVAECLAIIAALQAAKQNKIFGAVFCTDSQLVFQWVQGGWRVKSATGRKFVPVIKRLIGKVSGKLRWIPGVLNLADANSRGRTALARR